MRYLAYFIAPVGQTAIHLLQPTHLLWSMNAIPPVMEIALYGHAGTHLPQPIHCSFVTVGFRILVVDCV